MPLFPLPIRFLAGLALAGSLALGAADLPEVQARIEQAVGRVREIVNQPVPGHAIGPDDHPAMFRPGWFHPGARVPDFDHVDVRTSQECGMYAKWPFVTSDLNPGVMFQGSAVEFNAMTKLFYADRALPKKKLTEAEMQEVNGLYRSIGAGLAEVRRLRAAGGTAGDPGAAGLPAELANAAPRPGPPRAGAPEPGRPGLLSPRTGIAAVAVLGLLLAWSRVRRRAA